jgi:hypothetical protein
VLLEAFPKLKFGESLIDDAHDGKIWIFLRPGLDAVVLSDEYFHEGLPARLPAYSALMSTPSLSILHTRRKAQNLKEMP